MVWSREKGLYVQMNGAINTGENTEVKDVHVVTLNLTKDKVLTPRLPEKKGEYRINEPYQPIGCTYQLLGLPS